MMKKAKGEDGGGSKSMISELPEGILQRIIYFLSQEEAVRTSVLSKSWRYIWCTRSNIDFSETTFKGKKHEFLSAVDKTLQRYCDQGPPLEEISLCMSLLGVGDRHPHHESVSLLYKWIPIILTTMGVALKEFRLSIVSEEQHHLSQYPCLAYDLIGDLPDNKKIQFERLQVLALQRVFITPETFDKIISSCTLLTTICFEECRGFKTIELDKKLHKHLKHFTSITFIRDKSPTIDESTIEIVIGDMPTLETIKFVGGMIRFLGGHKFNNLKSITLKLPCFVSEEISIDAPNLLYFEYRGTVVPSISFAPHCKRSNIALLIYCLGDALSWFSRISQLLQALRESEISLNIDYIHGSIKWSPILQDRLVPDFVNGGNKPVVVENLRLRYFSLFALSSALNGLLCISHPRNITHPGFREPQSTNEVEQKKLTEYLCCTLLMMKGSGNQEVRQGLEAVSIQKRFGSKWEPIQSTAFLECPQLNHIRFQLEWRKTEACQSES